MNIKGYAISLKNNNIKSLKRFVQNGVVLLTNNKIESLEGFIQTYYLDLSSNEIKTLNNFVQHDTILLNNNPITELGNFLIKNDAIIFIDEILLRNPSKKVMIFCDYHDIPYLFIETNNLSLSI